MSHQPSQRLTDLSIFPPSPTQHPSGESSLLALADSVTSRSRGGSLSLASIDGASSTGSLQSMSSLPVFHGNSVVIIRDVDQVCCGIIGTESKTSKFCSLSIQDCQTAKHKGSKVTIDPGYYILDAGNRQKKACFLAPTLPLSLVSED